MTVLHPFPLALLEVLPVLLLSTQLQGHSGKLDCPRPSGPGATSAEVTLGTVG